MKTYSNFSLFSLFLVSASASAKPQEKLSTQLFNDFACYANVTWGSPDEAGYFQERYDCASAKEFLNQTRWCRMFSNYDPCPVNVGVALNCDLSSTLVTTGDSTLPYLFPDALVTASDACHFQYSK